MSVGHFARGLESAGIPTVGICIEAFAHVAAYMRLPRTLVTPHPMGRTIGAPGNTERQRSVVVAALELLATATAGDTIERFDQPYRPWAG